MQDTTIHAVVFRSGEWFVVQCLEYDIATQAKTQSALLDELERLITAHVLIAAKEDREPFAGLPRAPKRFWQMYAEARAKLEPVRDPVPTEHVDVPRLELRAA